MYSVYHMRGTYMVRWSTRDILTRGASHRKYSKLLYVDVDCIPRTYLCSIGCRIAIAKNPLQLASNSGVLYRYYTAPRPFVPMARLTARLAP